MDVQVMFNTKWGIHRFPGKTLTCSHHSASSQLTWGNDLCQSGGWRQWWQEYEASFVCSPGTKKAMLLLSGDWWHKHWQVWSHAPLWERVDIHIYLWRHWIWRSLVEHPLVDRSWYVLSPCRPSFSESKPQQLALANTFGTGICWERGNPLHEVNWCKLHMDAHSICTN